MAERGSSARRYAEAAWEIALRDGTADAWLGDLHRAAAAFTEPRVAEILRNPTVPVDERRRLVEGVAGGRLSARSLNLVTLLLQRGRIELLPQVAAELQRLADRNAGVTRAFVTSASALSADERRRLTDRLAQLTGGTVELTTQVDPGILGGVVVRLGDRMIDGSVRGRLERLRSQLVSGAL